MKTKNSIIIYLLLVFVCIGATKAQNSWFQTHPLRIYHPNMKEIESKDFDVKKFIADCKELH
ncbi:MAG: hypothetical protein WAL29_15950, partial [Bacteroidales bacterium]